MVALLRFKRKKADNYKKHIMKKNYPISTFTLPGAFVLLMLMLGLSINLQAQYTNLIKVKIIGHTMETDYNRLEQHVSGYDVIIDDNNDHVFTIADIMFIGGEEDSIARGTNANNTYYMNLEDKFQVKAPYYFVNVQIEVTNGSLTINPKHVDVTITGKTNSITYDGTSHEFGYMGDYDIEIIPLDAGYPEDTLVNFVQFQSVTGTNKGSYTGNVVLLPPTDAGNYVETISVEDYALLEIEQAALTITAKDQTYPYTGSPQGPGDILIVDDFDQYFTATDLQGADQLKSITLDGQATDVGVHSGALVLSDAVIWDAAGERVEGNYAITYVNGSITITSTVPDCDGVVDYGDYSYETIQIGTQCWLTENLRIAEDAAGNEIGTPLFDDEANVGKFGLLYTWYEAMGVEEGETPAAAGFVQGICPEGWHIPSHADMMALKSVVDGNVQYLRDKDPMQQYWIESARGVDPNYGFQSRGSGCYNSTSGHFEEYMLREHYWESVSDPNSDLVEVAGVTYFCDEIMLESSSRNDKRSVRCLRDE